MMAWETITKRREQDRMQGRADALEAEQNRKPGESLKDALARLDVKGSETKEPPIKDTARLFRENSVLIIDWHEGTENALPEIRFNGDESAGFTAVEVAREIGLTPWKLKRVWHHIYDLENHPHWELTFSYRPLGLLPLKR